NAILINRRGTSCLGEKKNRIASDSAGGRDLLEAALGLVENARALDAKPGIRIGAAERVPHLGRCRMKDQRSLTLWLEDAIGLRKRVGQQLLIFTNGLFLAAADDCFVTAVGKLSEPGLIDEVDFG